MDNRAYATSAAQPEQTSEPLLNTVNGILSESIELLHAATEDVRKAADGIRGPVPTPIGKDSDRTGGANTPARGIQCEANARTVRDLIFGLRNQINRLPAI